MGNDLRITHHMLGHRPRPGQWAPSLYCEGLDAKLDRHLAHLFHQDHVFILPGLAIGRSHATSVQHDPVTPSSALLVPPISSPCPGANGGIDLLAIGSSGCLTSRPPQTNQTWEGELTELLVMKGC